MSELRVVSLLPSATEIVAALGFAEALVGRSHECDAPEEIRRLPACTSTALDPTASSGAIDRRLQRLLENALSIYRVDASRLRRLRPTHVVTQLQCARCAATPEDVARALAGWDAPPRLIALTGSDLAGVFADFERTAAALGAPSRGTALVRRVARRIRRIRAGTRALARPRVAVLEWVEPLLGAGNWIPELVAAAGGEPVLGDAGRHSSGIAAADLLAAAPEVVVVAPCGFPLARAVSEARRLTRLPGWRNVPAVRSGRVYVADGNRYFNRPGPSLAETLEILTEILHPERFEFGHENRGWRKWQADSRSAARRG